MSASDAAGLAFAILCVAGVAIPQASPGPSGTDEEVADYFRSDGDRRAEDPQQPTWRPPDDG